MNNVDKPLHYQTASGMQPIDVIEAFELGFNLGNAIKYILRAGKKDAKEQELQKAVWYLNRELNGAETLDELLETMPDEEYLREMFKPTKEVYFHEGATFVITRSNSMAGDWKAGAHLTFDKGTLRDSANFNIEYYTMGEAQNTDGATLFTFEPVGRRR